MLKISQNGCTSLKELDLHDAGINFFSNFAHLEPITSFEMDTLTNIVASLPDTITIATTPKEVIFHTCPVSTTWNDIFFAIAIGLIVLAGLAIIGRYVSKSIIAVSEARRLELNSRQAHELAKLCKEAEIKEVASLFNAEQTRQQREWLSEADRLKNDMERQNVRFKEAETDVKISELEKKKTQNQENTQS